MWKTNLVICVTIVALVAGYFFYQVQNASGQFRKNSREHSKVLAAAVELNIRNAMLSNEGLELVIVDFLKNSARFIWYLNTVEPFRAAELSALAAESGLAGISIVGQGQEGRVEGPPGWGGQRKCSDYGKLVLDGDRHLYSLVYAGGEPEARSVESCVVVGFSAQQFASIQENVSVEMLLQQLARLPGIASVQLQPKSQQDDGHEEQLATLAERDGQQVTETRISIADRELIVTQYAGHFAKRLRQMRSEFFIFIGVLVLFGAISSWWLYHAERLRLNEARAYEQEMARQHEEAALGRAAATIAHEIRNPLNAIGMGLQRLQLETQSLSSEHHDLLVSMREAVNRSNGIVSSLQQYVRSLEVVRKQVNLGVLLQRVVKLYEQACREQGIRVVAEIPEECHVAGDEHLLGQLFENVVKNAVEAQQGGGFLTISVRCPERHVVTVVKNGGFTLSATESSSLFEPYFTTKTKGTGLGLSISKKIVEAHGGSVEAYPDVSGGKLILVIRLPQSV